jgi:acetyl esterase/lipase
MSPWVDLRPERTYPNEHTDPWLTAIGSLNASRAYAGTYDPSDVGLTPLLNSHVGLSATYIEAAGDDILVTEGRELAAAMKAAGVAVEYHETSGCFHVFPLVGLLPEAKAARAREAAWFNSVLN